MRYSIIGILGIAAMFAACAGNHRQPNATLPNGSPVYDASAVEASYYVQQQAILKKDSLKAVESTDWLKFRKEFLKCKFSQPDRFSIMGLESVMTMARKSGDRNEELKLAQEVLDRDFTNISAHYTFVKDSSVDANVREYHKQVIGGLLRSIRDSGKGISKETAMYVINIGEEYDFIYFSGMKPMMQSLINENGRQFDVMDTEDREGNKYRLYFEVTDFFGHY